MFIVSTAAGLPFSLLYPPDGLELFEPQVDVMGVTRPDAVIGVNGVPLQTNCLGIFFTTVTLEEGPNLIEIVATDISSIKGDVVTIFEGVVYDGNEEGGLPVGSAVVKASKVRERLESMFEELNAYNRDLSAGKARSKAKRAQRLAQLLADHGVVQLQLLDTAQQDASPEDQPAFHGAKAKAQAAIDWANAKAQAAVERARAKAQAAIEREEAKHQAATEREDRKANGNQGDDGDPALATVTAMVPIPEDLASLMAPVSLLTPTRKAPTEGTKATAEIRSTEGSYSFPFLTTQKTPRRRPKSPKPGPSFLVETRAANLCVGCRGVRPSPKAVGVRVEGHRCYNVASLGTRGFDRGCPCRIAGRGAITPRKKMAQK